MKRVLICFFLSILALCVVPKSMYAEEFSPEEPYNVNYKEDGTLETDFDYDEIAAILNDVQPGDTATITVNINNTNPSQAIDWWMDNKTLRTLEEIRETANSAGYEYTLMYQGSDGKTYDFFANEIGGEINPQAGFNEATEGLEDYFKMQEASMQPSQSGVLTLSVTLDGESSDYFYQQNYGVLRLDFAVEIPYEPDPRIEEVHIPRIVYIPYTGDTIHLNFYIILELLSLLLLAIITLAYFLYSRRQGGAR